MKRLEILKKLIELETTRNNIKNLMDASNNFYLHNVIITANIITRDYNNKYKGEEINVDNKLFSDYLKSEIESIDLMVKELTQKLLKL